MTGGGGLSSIGRWVALIGVFLQVVGLGATAWRQAARPSPASDAGLLSGASLDHVVFLAGLGVTLLGLLAVIGVALLQRADGGPRGAVRAATAAVVAAVLLLAGGSFAYALQNTHASTTHAPTDSSVHFKNAQLEALEGGFHQGNHLEAPVTYDQLRRITSLLDTMRAASAPYQDVRAAIAAGYRQVSQDIPMLGAHFVNFDIAGQRTFDPAQPPILLYERVKGTWKLVGVSYLLPKRGANADQPTVIPGPLAVWHDHTNLCFDPHSLAIAVLDERDCAAKSDLWLRDTGWMIHVWIWKDSPQGVFSHVNSTVQ